MAVKASEVAVPLIFGSIGVIALVRGLWRSSRGVVKGAGQVAWSAAGASSFGTCDPFLKISTTKGDPVFSMTSGKAVVAGGNFVQIASDTEAVILAYQGLVPSVKQGEYVTLGSQIGVSEGVVAFGVTQFSAGNKASYVYPDAWLASRGLGASHTFLSNGVRSVTVSKAAQGACQFALPEAPGFALLPVSINQT